MQSEAKSVILHVEHGKAVCPACGRLTTTVILPETQLENFPLYCKKCKHETLVTYPAPALYA